jgi:dipeptide/tripeptide permease
LIYVLGLASITIGSVNQFGMSLRSVLNFVGLFVVALATGGIKPCVSSFAADQVTSCIFLTNENFSLASQDRPIELNFSVFSILQ